MRINKSQVRTTIRRAIEAFNQGGDALWALNAGRPIGLPALTGVEGRRLQQAYTQRGEEGAVAVAVQMLRDAGFTVVDDESGTTSDLFVTAPVVAADDVPRLVIDAQAAFVAPLTTGSVEAYATGLADALFEGGRQAGVRYLAEVAGVKGLTVTTEQVTEIVTNFAEALKDDGIEYATESLQEAYDGLRSPAVTTTPVDLEGRVARLEQIARAQGLL